MSINRQFVCLAIAGLALIALVAVLASPAAASDWTSKYAGPIDNGSTHTYNNCFLRFDITGNDSVRVTVSAPGYAIQTYTISPGNFGDYNLLVRIYVAEVNATSGQVWVDISVPTDSVDATPTPVPGGTRLSCETPGVTALAGDTVVFPLAIQNNNNDDRTYTLSASSGTGWGLRFTTGSTGIYKVFIPAHQSRTVNLEVQTSGATGVGEKKITAGVDNQAIDLFVDITSINQSADVSFDVSSKIASIGDKITYSLKIKNLQSQENIYRLAASGFPANWYYRFKSDASSQEELAEVVIPAGAERNLVLEIVPPYSVDAGDYNFTASVTSPEGSTISDDLMLRLKSSVSMGVVTAKLAYDAKPGESFNIDVYVQNTGNGAALTNVYLDPKAPDGWTVQVTPNRTASLTAGNTQMFRARVTPPGNIVPSDYDVTLTAKSDQAEQEKDFRITVKVDSIVPYIGGGIILLVVVGLVLMYRKYGRR